MKVISPATGKVISEVEEDSKESINKKYLLARSAQVRWKKESLSHRITYVEKFSKLLLKNIDKLSMELSSEVGKPIAQARGEIKGAAQKCEFFIKESEKYLLKEKVNTNGGTDEFISYDPLGVITNISAWNYPYLVGINIFIPALITGNAVLYKPSELAILVGKSIHQLIIEAGVPKDVFQLIVGGAGAGVALCELPLDGYFFTGSYRTGQKIAVAVADKLVPVGLELGGKDPLYITNELSSIEEAAISAAEGAFYNNGQSCCSVERIYIHEEVYDEFKEHFVDYAKKLIVGAPDDPKTNMGAITRKDQIPFYQKLIEDALSKGASLAFGGKEIPSEGNFFEPTVLIHVDHSMLCMQEETFGPVIGLQKVSSDKEAIELMNDTEYGLTSAVFTSNKTRGEKILEETNSGTGYLNCCDRVSGYLPWSGRGHSGLGSTLSKHGLYTFCHLKGLHIRK